MAPQLAVSTSQWTVLHRQREALTACWSDVRLLNFVGPGHLGSRRGFCNWGHLNCFHTPSEKLTREEEVGAGRGGEDTVSVIEVTLIVFTLQANEWRVTHFHPLLSVSPFLPVFVSDPSESYLRLVSHTVSRAGSRYPCHHPRGFFCVQHPLCPTPSVSYTLCVQHSLCPTPSVSQHPLCHNTLCV